MTATEARKLARQTEAFYRVNCRAEMKVLENEFISEKLPNKEIVKVEHGPVTYDPFNFSPHQNLIVTYKERV